MSLRSASRAASCASRCGSSADAAQQLRQPLVQAVLERRHGRERIFSISAAPARDPRVVLAHLRGQLRAFALAETDSALRAPRPARRAIAPSSAAVRLLFRGAAEHAGNAKRRVQIGLGREPFLAAALPEGGQIGLEQRLGSGRPRRRRRLTHTSSGSPHGRADTARLMAVRMALSNGSSSAGRWKCRSRPR